MYYGVSDDNTASIVATCRLVGGYTIEQLYDKAHENAYGSHCLDENEWSQARMIFALCDAPTLAGQARQWLQLVGYGFVTHAEATKLAMGAKGEPTAAAYSAAHQALANGATQAEAAAVSGMSVKLVNTLAKWTGVAQWREDQRLTDAVLSRGDGEKVADWAARWGLSVPRARAIWGEAGRVLAELESLEDAAA